MSVVEDTQFGQLSLDGTEFCGAIRLGSREVPVALEIQNADALPVPATLLHCQLDELLRVALVRVRSDEDETVSGYVEHHIDVLDASAWLSLLPEGATLSTASVRQCIELLRVWGSYDGELRLYLDHGLSEDVTDYVLSVSVDASGAIEDVAMES